MSSFSERSGVKRTKNAIQLQSMDADLRNSLWSALLTSYWEKARGDSFEPFIRLSYFPNKDLKTFCDRLWLDFLKKPLDTLYDNWGTVLADLRKYFFSCPWNEVYDFIEFVAQNYPDRKTNELFTKNCNQFLERELAGYRFIDNQIAPITDPIETEAIEDASDSKFPSAREHLDRSISMFSDRKDPDYRNSIKESISAVEALVKQITKSEKGTLGALLKTMETAPHHLHPALRKAFSELYGYTSDEKGIRHALLNDADPVTFEEAKFMLVACSAFVNYVTGTLKD